MKAVLFAITATTAKSLHIQSSRALSVYPAQFSAGKCNARAATTLMLGKSSESNAATKSKALRAAHEELVAQEENSWWGEISPSDLPYHAEDAERLDALMRVAVGGGARASSKPQLPPTEIDLCISGGGLRGYFMLGARHAIESRDDLVIRRYCGTSAGAWTALFMATGMSSADWLATYTLTAEASRRAEAEGKVMGISSIVKPYKSLPLIEAYRQMWPWMKTIMPPDAHKRCTGKLHITITNFVLGRPRAQVISSFASNEELFEACIAASSVPLVTQRGVGTLFRKRIGYDGLFSGQNLPTFDDNARPQLLFDLGKVPYGPWAISRPLDNSIEGLAVSGALQTSRFLSGRRADPEDEVSSWLGWEDGLEYPNHVQAVDVEDDDGNQADGGLRLAGQKPLTLAR